MFGSDLRAKMTPVEFVYIFVMILINLAVYESGVKLAVMLSINGAVIGYIYVIIIPVWVHLKCVFFDRTGGQIEGDEDWNARIKPNPCHCECSYTSKAWLYLETAFLFMLVIVGLLLMVFTMTTLNTASTPATPSSVTNAP
jgi:hypothetical protein